MKKVTIIILLIFILPFLYIGYYAISSSIHEKKVEDKASALTISIDNKQLSYVSQKTSDIDNQELFDKILDQGYGIEAPYVKLGDTIEISFKGSAPDKVRIFDVLIRDKDNPIYKESDVSIITDESKDSYTFTFTEHKSAKSKEENLNSIRGYKVIVKWGNSQYEYAFMLRPFDESMISK